MTTVKAIRLIETGGPEVMSLEDVTLEPPGPGMVTVRNHAIGLNYIDTYHRSGLYPLPLPTGIGLEAAGVVEAVGEGAQLQVGDRVAYCSAGFGAYAEALKTQGVAPSVLDAAPLTRAGLARVHQSLTESA